jgi:hypothetical protein
MKHTITDNRLMRIALAAILILALTIMPIPPGKTDEVYAKTSEAQKAENLFFYVKNSAGQDVLLKIMTLAELKALSHDNGGKNYYYSATDNLPAVVYTEAQGFTVPELIDAIKSTSPVAGAENITYTGDDEVNLMASDSGDNYMRTWKYDDLYGSQGYYYKDIFRSDIGWNKGWEIEGDGYNPQSTVAMPYSLYVSKYKGNDTYANDKSTISGTKVTMPAILSVESQGDRISALENDYDVNRNNVTGSLAGELTDENALTLSLPQTEDVFYSGNRTMYHCFKWIYNIRLDMANDPVVTPLGRVETPTADIRIDDTDPNAPKLLVDFDCGTTGAAIYYSVGNNEKSIVDSNAMDYGTAPIKEYTGSTVSIDLKPGVDLKSSPVKIYMKAVREGYTDKPIETVSYPAQAPAFKTVPNTAIGNDVTFTAADTVTADAWSEWTGKISSVTVQYPNTATYAAIAADKRSIDNTAKTLTIDKSVFTAAGYHTIKIDAGGYSIKTTDVSMKKTAPAITPVTTYFGERIDIPITDAAYLSAVSVKAKKEGTESESTIDSKYIVKSSGKLSVSPDYFRDANTKFTEPGKYIIDLSATDYTPSVNSVTVTIKPEGDNSASAFEYALTANNIAPKTGDKITVSATLSSNNGNYTFYAGEYRLVIDANLTVSNIKNANGWESGVAASGGKTILTFAKLDTTGDGILHKAVQNLGTFDLTAGSSAGKGNITISSALLTDDVGLSRNKVTGKGLSISISKKDTTPNEDEKNKDAAQKKAEAAAAKVVPKVKQVTVAVAKKAAKVKIKAVKGATRYKLRYKIKGTKKWKTVTITISKAKKGFKIKGLKKGKKYEIQYAVIKKVGLQKKPITSKWSNSRITKKIK